MSRRNSTARALASLEVICRQQPIGVSELARVLEEDKSAVQRALTTLAQEGWIQPTTTKPTRWELSARIYTLASMGRGPQDLRVRARPVMAKLRDLTGETIILNVAIGQVFMVTEVVESHQMVRSAPSIGMAIPTEDSATGRATLAFMPPDQQVEFLGNAPDAAMLADFELVKRVGYFVSPERWRWASENIAAPVFGQEGKVLGALVLSAPAGRLSPSECDKLGVKVADAARKLSLIEQEGA